MDFASRPSPRIQQLPTSFTSGGGGNRRNLDANLAFQEGHWKSRGQDLGEPMATGQIVSLPTRSAKVVGGAARRLPADSAPTGLEEGGCKPAKVARAREPSLRG